MEAAATADPMSLSDYISLSDYASAFLQETGGFDQVVFTTPVDNDYKCSICLKVLRNPMLGVVCGHHFCHSCIVRALERREACPHDRTPVSLQVSGTLVPDRHMKRHIGDFQVFCEKTEHGCTWTGTLFSYNAHKRVCPKVIVKCPFQCANTGCDYECMREDVVQHCQQQSAEHNQMMVQRMDVLTNSLWQVATCPVEHRQTVHTEIFDQMDQRLVEGRTFYSDAFYSGPCESGYRLRMKIAPSKGRLRLYYSLVKGKNDDLLDWPFRHHVIVQCLHITNDEVVAQKTMRPPTDDDGAWGRLCTGRPSETNSLGWGNESILSQSDLMKAGMLWSDRVRIRFILLWDL
ncbi:TNF receptor-associated factor 3-like [Sycon ciliatum]|uniref:TNF receptor-associated factor 3-like n=1 Tax=Sycon ciliatum TaxID=27933 RepID=UPI0031F70F98